MSYEIFNIVTKYSLFISLLPVNNSINYYFIIHYVQWIPIIIMMSLNIIIYTYLLT